MHSWDYRNWPLIVLSDDLENMVTKVEEAVSARQKEHDKEHESLRCGGVRIFKVENGDAVEAEWVSGNDSPL